MTQPDNFSTKLDPAAALKQGIYRSLRSRSYEQVITFGKLYGQRHGDHPQVLFMMARAYYKLDQLEECRQRTLRMRDVGYPEDIEKAEILEIKALIKEKNLDKLYDKLLEIKEASPDFFYHTVIHFVADRLIRRGYKNAAIEILEQETQELYEAARQARVEEKEPERRLVSAGKLLAVYRKDERFHEALELCKKYLEVTPDDFVLHNIHAQLLMDTGKWNEGVAILRTQMGILRNSACRNILAQAFAREGDLEEAERLFRENHRLFSREPQVVSSFCEFLIETGRRHEADRIWNEYEAAKKAHFQSQGEGGGRVNGS